MKYGLLTFKNTDNLGDDIQSYAQMRFLPRIDCYVDRESLDTFAYKGDPDEIVSVIMNAWFLHTKFNWPPAKAINPLFVSSHFSQYDRFGIGYSFIDGLGGEYLRHYAPIGVRDETTRDALEEHGIPAYVTGCMTLTLQRQEGIESQRAVVLCDLPEDLASQIDEVATAEGYSVMRVTHTLDPREHSRLSFDERFEQVRERLALYQSSAMVITTRLHCALPCLAVGTPVLLVTNGDGLDRLGSFLRLVHHCDMDQALDTFKMSWVQRPPENSDGYLEFRKTLEEACQKFVAYAELGMLEKGPFDASLEERVAWQKQLVRAGECERFASLIEQDAWLHELHAAKCHLEGREAELQGYCESLLARIHDLDEQSGALNAALGDLREQNMVLEASKHMLAKQLKQQDDRMLRMDGEMAQTKQRLHDVEHSLSFRVGRIMTYLPRKGRDAISALRANI